MRRRVLVLAAVAAGALAVAALATASLTSSSPAVRRAPATTYPSAALRGTGRFAIALPPGYRHGRRRYPVVYVLHGLPDDGTGYRDVPITRMAATAARAGHPVIVVAPQGARRGRTDDEWHDWGPGRDWETATARELVTYVDRRWRTIPDRRSRAIIGFSAGGYGAVIIGLHHPETYSVVESWSGYFRPTTPDGEARLDVGSRSDDRAADAHDFVGCLQRLAPRYRPRFFGFYIGDSDTYGDFIAENRRLDRELAAAGVPHAFALYHGGHNGAFWAAHERDWLLAAVRRLDAAPPRRPTDPTAARAAARRAGCPQA